MARPTEHTRPGGFSDPRRGGPLDRWAGTLVLLWGWRRLAVSAGAGGVAALAQAPLHWFPALWIALPVLVFLIDGAFDPARDGRVRRWRSAFLVGWSFGAGYFLAGLWWIGAAFLVDVAMFGWMIPFALAGLALGLGLFMGLGVALARLLWSDGPGRILALAAGLSVSEWLRGHVLTGFPWNALGYGLAANDPLMQAASLVGLEGMTVLAVAIFAAPAALAGGRRRDIAAVATAAVVFAGLWGWGAWRLAAIETAYVPDVKLRIMQPAVDQWRKWRPEYRAEIMNRYVELTGGPDGKGLEGVTHLIWPESAFPFLLTSEPWALQTIADLLPSTTTLLTGAIRAEPPPAGEDRPRYYNSVFVIGEDARIHDAFDKVHLVPFGEYLPAQDWLEAVGLRQLTQLRGGFTAGQALRTLSVPGAPTVGPLICYEAIFPGAVVDPDNRPHWLLNVTNDAWFGMTPGPYQHLHQVRLRAVEEGLPIVRAANSGVSAVIDAQGRVVASLALGRSGVIDSRLPAQANATTYSRYRSYPFWLAVIGVVSLGIIRGGKKT